MTCIVGIANKGKVYIGGDSAGVSGYDVTIRKDRKVFSNDEFVMGFTSSFRMGQVLQYDFTPPEITDADADDVMAYMVKKFVAALRTTFQAAGYSHIDSNRETGGCFLVGVRGRLFSIQNDFQVGESVSGYDAVGCGAHYANGSLFTTASEETLKPQWRVEKALEAAAHFSGGVAPPFHLVNN